MKKKISNVGKWNELYEYMFKNIKTKDDSENIPWIYGRTPTYRIGANFLKNCLIVEDWGCGAGHFNQFRKTGYVGIDGSKSPFADKIADLCEYKSAVEGIFIRHVLEHNENWKKMLNNVLQSATKKVCLVLFTPFSDKTTIKVYDVPRSIDVPDIFFKREDIEDIIKKYGTFTYQKITKGYTQYFQEHVYKITIKKVPNTINNPRKPLKIKTQLLPAVVCAFLSLVL